MNNAEHIGIILDGNRRWAKERGLPPSEGHIKGLGTAKKAIIHAQKRGMKMLTLFVFSTENWKRGADEVGFLMDLIEKFFREEHEKNKEDSLFGKIKLKVVGERGKLSDKIKEIIKKVEEDTKNNTSMILNIAFSYGGRMEIVEAIKKIIEKKIPLDEINEKVMKDNLSVPDLDLIIRTGREQRLSNFFIWQSAYSELYFSNKYWPDFSEDDFDEALKEYERRQRRFGK